MGKSYKITGNLEDFSKDWVQRDTLNKIWKHYEFYRELYHDEREKRLKEIFGNYEFKNISEIEPPRKKEPQPKIEYYFSNN
jgi:hypothetical protein